MKSQLRRSPKPLAATMRPDVEEQAAAEVEAFEGFGWAGADAQAEEVVEGGGDGDEKQAAEAELGQEEHACDDEDGESQGTLPGRLQNCCPVEQADRYQEDEVRCGGGVHERPEGWPEVRSRGQIEV